MKKSIIIEAGRAIATWLLAGAALCAEAQMSPNGKIEVTADGDSGLSVICHNSGKVVKVMEIECGKATPYSKSTKKYKVSYNMLTGKRSHCTNQYREQAYTLSSGQKLLMRAYDDGIAWHTDAPDRVDLSNADHRYLMRWNEAYEGFFPEDEKETEGDRWGYPALFRYTDGTWLLLSESNLDADCAAASMHSTARTGEYNLIPDGPGKKGWQTAIIGTLDDVVASTLVTDNSAPCRLDDTSWIEPGTASWVYWAYNHGSNDYEIIRKYVDMAVELGLPYVLIDAEWDEMKDGKSVEDAVSYALQRGIKPMIWYNSSVGWINGAPGPKFRLNKPEDREREFAWCEKIGVKGVKIDFFSGDTNLNIRYMTELLECAAKHHLLVNFHGATVPRGWQRTYPNLISTEGVYGAEWYNNVPTFTDRAASHNAMLPFTRNVIGSMDYTPCAFSDSQHPHITTRGHELALTILYESGIQHLADRPESFLSQPDEVRQFLGSFPTAWDDTVLLDGEPGRYAVLARRKGKKWYIAGINGTDEPMELHLSIGKLPKKATTGKKKFFTDNGDSSDWVIREIKGMPSMITLAPRGGFVIK